MGPHGLLHIFQGQFCLQQHGDIMGETVSDAEQLSGSFTQYCNPLCNLSFFFEMNGVQLEKDPEIFIQKAEMALSK